MDESEDQRGGEYDFKLQYTEKKTKQNSVSILIDNSLKNEIVTVRRQKDNIIIVKLVTGDLILNVISAYAYK
jgi:hypothetical protein